MVKKLSTIKTLLFLQLSWLLPTTVLAQPADKLFPEGSIFQWRCSEPLIPIRDVPGITCHSIKDPSVVRFQNKWYVFATIRGQERTHATVMLSFDDWQQAKNATWHTLTMHPGYFCAPQVFYFTPHQQWYLICQASNSQWGQKYGPAFATCKRIDDPAGWTELQPMFDTKPQNLAGWIDFWVICDRRAAHLFFTSNDGHMWRCQTGLDKFPIGWSTPEVVLKDDIFEASHIYRLADSNKSDAQPNALVDKPANRQIDKPTASNLANDQYLAIIEAEGGAEGFRYYKAYTAPTLDGKWQPLAASKQHNFASMLNIQHPEKRWTDAISHGELLRSGIDEHMEIDPHNLQFLFQGVRHADQAGKPYGLIPWQIGMLEATAP